MKKNEIIGYAITEEVSEPVNENTIDEIKVGNLHYLRFPAVLQTFNKLNRNRRDYGGKAMYEGLTAENIQELLATGNLFGEAGHPNTKDMSRILTIMPDMTSHRIKSLDIQSDHVSGIIETLPDNGLGTKMANLMLTGTMPSFSLRAVAPLIKRPDGTTLIRQKPRVVTYDWVVFPSHKEAYQIQSRPVENVIKDIRAGGNYVTESAVPVFESQVLDFLKEESNNLKLVSSVHETGLGNMRLTSDGQFVIVQENGQRFAVAIEDKIRTEVNSFMANF